MTYSDPSPWFVGFLVVVVAYSYVQERLGPYVAEYRERREPTALEALKMEYSATDMSDEEFSRRVEDLLDPGDEEIRERVEQVGGVGSVVAGEVAVHFESLEHVRQADRDELQEVPDVGPARAESIARSFA